MSFSQMAGNRDARDRLRKMVSSGRVPPSLLFSGPEGAGKLQAAMNLAKALNCARTQEAVDDACDTCPICIRIDQGNYSDVRRIGREGPGGQVRADAVRQVITESPFRPFEGRKRVYIFEDADRMNPSAAATLLKTLEEPPPWTVLCLLTAHEAAILPTLISRCQRIRFIPLSPEEVARILTQEHGVTEHEASLASAMSGGNLEKALAALKEELDFMNTQALRIASVASSGTSYLDIVSLAGQLSKSSELAGMLRLLLGLLRDLASLASGGYAFINDTTGVREELARRAPLEVWLEAYLRVERALHDVETRYTNKRVTLEQLLIRLNGLARAKPSREAKTGGRSRR